MEAHISQALSSATASLKEADKAKYLDGTVHHLGIAQTELLMAILKELGRLNYNLENTRNV